jgi:hypothetical protein
MEALRMGLSPFEARGRNRCYRSVHGVSLRQDESDAQMKVTAVRLRRELRVEEWCRKRFFRHDSERKKERIDAPLVSDGAGSCLWHHHLPMSKK